MSSVGKRDDSYNGSIAKEGNRREYLPNFAAMGTIHVADASFASVRQPTCVRLP